MLTNDEIFTQGNPTGNTRALLQVNLTTQGQPGIDARNSAYVYIHNIRIDGGGMKPCGGPWGQGIIAGSTGGQNLNIYRVRVQNTTGAGIHVDGFGCYNANVSYNEVFNAGVHNGCSGGQNPLWADGIFAGCRNSFYTHNDVKDATDVGINAGSPGSVFQFNHLWNTYTTAFAAICMTDHFNSGDYQGTLVSGNTIGPNSGSGYFEQGIPMGPRIAWCGTNDVNYGATVSNNTIYSPGIGYGYMVNGVRDWTVQDNAFVGPVTGNGRGGCDCTVPWLLEFAYGDVAINCSFQWQFGYRPCLEYLHPVP